MEHPPKKKKKRGVFKICLDLNPITKARFALSRKPISGTKKGT